MINLTETSQKPTLERHAKASYCVEEIDFVYMDGDTIRRYVDMDYRGDGKQVLVIEYKPEMCACNKYILHWEGRRPDDIVEEWNI